MATRPIRYELHIKPLIRLIDRENMLEVAFDLWDYDQVRANADAILRRSATDMPPLPFGGPWPAEWVATFQRWKDEGFLRLDLGSVDATGYAATRTGDTVSIACRGKTPTGGYRSWLQATLPEGQPREYTLYWEPPVPALPANPSVFRARAKFQAPATMTEIAIVDAGGRTVVPIVAAPAPVSVPGPLPPVRPALESLGAVHLDTSVIIGGTVSRFRLGDSEIEMFHDGFRAEFLGGVDALEQIRPAVEQLGKSILKR